MRAAAAVLILFFLAAGCYEGSGKANDGGLDPTTDDGGFDPITEEPAEEGPAECQPPLTVSARLLVNGEEYPLESSDREWSCVVDSVTQETGRRVLDLACRLGDGEEEPVTIELYLTPDFLIVLPPAGTDVTLRYLVEVPWWSNRWLVLRDETNYYYAVFVDAARLAPEELDSWYSPLSVSVASGLCAPELAECGDEERVALDVAYRSSSITVFDHTRSTLLHGSIYHIWVEEAVVTHDVSCEDFPETWFRAFMVFGGMEL